MATTPKAFDVPKRTPTVLEFTLGDDDLYTFTPPKTSGMLLDIVVGDPDADNNVAATRASLNWLSDGLPDDQAQRILDRLRDPDDDLDTDTLNEVIKWLVEQASNRPTRRRTASS